MAEGKTDIAHPITIIPMSIFIKNGDKIFPHLEAIKTALKTPSTESDKDMNDRNNRLLNDFTEAYLILYKLWHTNNRIWRANKNKIFIGLLESDKNDYGDTSVSRQIANKYVEENSIDNVIVLDCNDTGINYQYFCKNESTHKIDECKSSILQDETGPNALVVDTYIPKKPMDPEKNKLMMIKQLSNFIVDSNISPYTPRIAFVRGSITDKLEETVSKSGNGDHMKFENMVNTYFDKIIKNWNKEDVLKYFLPTNEEATFALLNTYESYSQEFEKKLGKNHRQLSFLYLELNVENVDFLSVDHLKKIKMFMVT